MQHLPKKKAVFIGAGAIAREHLFAMQFIDNIETVALCDLSPARAQSAAERFKVPQWFSSHTEMLDKTEPDFVHIATPPAPHFALSKECLERGLNVLCEKPLTSTYKDFKILSKLALQKNRLLIENQNYRRQSSIMRIHEMLRTGELGEVVEAQVELSLDIHAKGGVYRDENVPHFTATMRGGVVADFITHMTYILQSFIGGEGEVASVWRTRNASQGPPDEFRALIKGTTATGYLSFSGNMQPAGFWLRVKGTRGQAEANLFEPPRIAFRMKRGGAAPLATVKDGLIEAKNIATTSVKGLYRKFSGLARYDGLEAYLRDCYAALDDPSAAPVTLSDLDDSARMIDALLGEEHRI